MKNGELIILYMQGDDRIIYRVSSLHAYLNCVFTVKNMSYNDFVGMLKLGVVFSDNNYNRYSLLDIFN